jgi:acylphosphatase
MNSYKIIFTGLVQGVGFRWHCKELCDMLKIDGYVKNLQDGTVELFIDTNKDMLDRIIRLLECTFTITNVAIFKSTLAPCGGFSILR